MRRKHSRALATVAAVLVGGLAALTLRPTAGPTTATFAARNPAVEVRTQVIRRTIHVIRHEPGARLPGPRGSSPVVVHAGGHVATAASGTHHSSSGTPSTAVATRASRSHAAGPAPPASSGSAVSTRTSGSHGSSSSGSAARPVTRSSGSSQHHGVDGGDGHAMAATSPRGPRTAGPDRFTVLTLTLAAFLWVLALLASQMRSAPVPRPRPVLVLRRVYETRVVETLVGPRGGGSSVTQSVSSRSPSSLASVPATRAC